MTRNLLIAACVGQMGVVFATIVAWPALFVPAMAGLGLLWLAFPGAGSGKA